MEMFSYQRRYSRKKEGDKLHLMHVESNKWTKHQQIRFI